MNCILTTEEITPDLIARLEAYEFPKDIVASVSKSVIEHHEGDGLKVGLIDLGLKKGIVRQLLALNCDVTIFPHNTTVDTIKSYSLDVLMFSNGPGDPKEAKAAIALAKALKGSMPLWGICLGHQILALALGADTYKLKFGHRGANHPVLEVESGKVFMSSQNHGYAVDESTLTEGMSVTFYNVNDQTNEGIACESLKITSVQFHPEEGPGPEDAHYIFGKWVSSLEKVGEFNA
jgi:carbamoyl-phosphate synthase small subunit